MNTHSHCGSQRKLSVELTETQLWEDICCSCLILVWIWNNALFFIFAHSHCGWWCACGEKSQQLARGRSGGSGVWYRNRIFREWDASQGHSLASGQDLKHYRSFLIVIPENALSCFPVHNQVLFQNLTQEFIIHLIRKERVSQIFPNSLVKEAHSQPSWGFLAVLHWKGKRHPSPFLFPLFWSDQAVLPYWAGCFQIIYGTC